MQIDVSYKKEGRKKRHRSLRKRIEGTAERPRLVVFRSARHIYVQVVNDLENKTLAAVSDKKLEKTTGEAGQKSDKKALAKQVGAAIAKSCLDKGIDKVVFDRAGYKYHGRVSALADGARGAGLKF
jgi:large subunit ribosomal protein L18